jgi:chromosomal replication initiation ATPase DnaA
MTALPTIAEIQRAVADEYGLTVAKLREPSPRGRQWINCYEISHPRQTAIALSVLLTHHGYTRIGHYFGGRDRKTIYHAHKIVAKRLKTDPELHNKMRRITLQLLRP